MFEETLITWQIFYSIFFFNLLEFILIQKITQTDRHILSLVDLLFCRIVSASLEHASH